MTTNFFLFSKNGHHNQFLNGERFYDQNDELGDAFMWVLNVYV